MTVDIESVESKNKLKWDVRWGCSKYKFHCFNLLGARRIKNEKNRSRLCGLCHVGLLGLCVVIKVCPLYGGVYRPFLQLSPPLPMFHFLESSDCYPSPLSSFSNFLPIWPQLADKFRPIRLDRILVLPYFFAYPSPPTTTPS